MDVHTTGSAPAKSHAVIVPTQISRCDFTHKQTGPYWNHQQYEQCQGWLHPLEHIDLTAEPPFFSKVENRVLMKRASQWMQEPKTTTTKSTNDTVYIFKNICFYIYFSRNANQFFPIVTLHNGEENNLEVTQVKIV